ncbi:MAG TPA: hypothetical protein DDW65_25355 [Firmicutes bacterium]|nr:hypothetical protein [Bacillota bacterium]
MFLSVTDAAVRGEKEGIRDYRIEITKHRALDGYSAGSIVITGDTFEEVQRIVKKACPRFAGG